MTDKLSVPFAIELDPAELDLLQGCVAGELARILMHHDAVDRGMYDCLVALGQKLGMEL